MRTNVTRCVECGDYTDVMVECPKCGKLVCEDCLASHLQQFHSSERGDRERSYGYSSDEDEDDY